MARHRHKHLGTRIHPDIVFGSVVMKHTPMIPEMPFEVASVHATNPSTRAVGQLTKQLPPRLPQALDRVAGVLKRLRDRLCLRNQLRVKR